MNQNERRKYLIRYLLDERPEYRKLPVPEEETEQKALLRGLMNIRMPHKTDPEFLKIQDEYLKEETRRKGVTSLKDLKPVEKNIYLWRGDITTLQVGVIVNAANSKMLGCFHPNHGCIDNAIHTYAGIQLRECCEQIMKEQKTPEKTGTAKITPAYNLPCQYVIHTVGPIVYGKLTEKDCDLLASCYRSCLQLAYEHHLKSIAFCCISTGEFHFPNEKAAEIAVKTVRNFLKEHNSDMEVVFNVFKKQDEEVYRKLLESGEPAEKRD